MASRAACFSRAARASAAEAAGMDEWGGCEAAIDSAESSTGAMQSSLALSRSLRDYLIDNSMLAQAVSERLDLRVLHAGLNRSQNLAETGADERLVAGKAKRRRNLF